MTRPRGRAVGGAAGLVRVFFTFEGFGVVGWEVRF